MVDMGYDCYVSDVLHDVLCAFVKKRCKDKVKKLKRELKKRIFSKLFIHLSKNGAFIMMEVIKRWR